MHPLAALLLAAPVWVEDPVSYTAMLRCPFSQPLSYYVQDAKGRVLSYRIVAGPAWLKVTPAGRVEGRPEGTADSLQTFTLEASNEDGSGRGTLELWLEERDPPCE
jgi:hypothetical protein